MMPITPSGTRILPTWMPLGRRLMSAVDHRRVEPVRARLGQIGRVGGQQFVLALAQSAGNGQQGLVLGLGGRGGDQARGAARLPANRVHVLGDIHGCASDQTTESVRLTHA
jgi:hypothetical protein